MELRQDSRGSRYAILLVGLLLLQGVSVWASRPKTELGVTPMLLSLEAEPGTTVETVIQVYNMQPAPPKVEIRLADLKQQTEGPWSLAVPSLEIDRPQSNSNSCQDWISVPNRPDQSSFESANLGWFPVPIRIQVPANAKGMYYAALAIYNDPFSLRSGVEINVELVVPVFVRIKGSFFPLDVRLTNANSPEHLKTTSAMISAPSCFYIDQCPGTEDPYHTYSGQFKIEISSTCGANLSITSTPTSPAVGDWSTNNTSTHVWGHLQQELTLTGTNVKIENLVGGKKNIIVADIRIQLIPNFQMVYTSNHLQGLMQPPYRFEDEIQAMANWIDHDKKNIQLIRQRLERIQKETRLARKMGFVGQELDTTPDRDQLNDNERQIKQDLQGIRAILGALANADVWLQWAEPHYLETAKACPVTQTWLLKETLPWIVRYLDQVQQWQTRSDVQQWIQSLDQLVFLPVFNGRPTIKPTPPMPSIVSIPIMPTLPQGDSGPAPASTARGIFAGDVRTAVSDIGFECNTLILVDPLVDGAIYLDLTRGKGTPLELALDMVCLSVNATWEKYNHYYMIKPRPAAMMSQPYSFKEPGSLQDRQQGKIVNGFFVGRLHNVLRDLGAEMQINIIIDPDAADGSVAMDLSSGVPLEITLDMVCLSTGNSWKKAQDFYTIMPNPKHPLDLPYPVTDAKIRSTAQTHPVAGHMWENIGLRSTLEDLSAGARINIVADASIPERKIYLSTMQELPFEVALDALCLSTDCIWRKTPYYYWVMPRQAVTLELPYPVLDAHAEPNEQPNLVTSYQWENASLRSALYDLSVEMGILIVADGSIGKKLTLTSNMQELPLEVALDAICLATDCIWKKTPYYYWVLPRQATTVTLPYPVIKADTVTERGGPPVSLLRENTKLTAVIVDLALTAGVNLVVEPGIRGQVTIDVQDEPLESVLDQLCAQVDCTWKKAAYYYVMTKNERLRQR